MKQIEIGGKVFDLSFGIDFIREMDKRYQIDAQGFPLGAGLQSAVIYLVQESPVVLEDIILSATNTLKSMPSKKAISEWIEEQSEANTLEQVYEDFLSTLKTAPMTKKKTNELLAAMEVDEA